MRLDGCPCPREGRLATATREELASGAEALAAFRAPASEHSSAILGRHACSEAVGTLTLEVTRLEGALHVGYSPHFKICPLFDRLGASLIDRFDTGKRAAILMRPPKGVNLYFDWWSSRLGEVSSEVRWDRRFWL